jgi:hypothetical protein
MKYIALVVILGGFLVSFYASLWLAVLAFRRSVLWGLIYLFVPFGALVFLYRNWEEARRPFFLGLKGWGVMVTGYVVLLFSAVGRAREAPAAPEQVAVAAPPVAVRTGPTPTPFPTPRPTPSLAPAAVAPASPRGASSESPGPGFGGLRVYFGTPFRDGRVIVQAHGVEVFNRVLSTPKGQPVAALDERIPLPPGETELKVWAISTDRTTNFYKAIPVSLPDGAFRTLTLDLQPAGLAYAVE